MLDIITILILSLAVSAISVTLARGGVFAALRQWVMDRNEWLGKLISCPYCLSHWVALFAVVFYPISMTFYSTLVTIFAVVAISAIVSGVITVLFPFEQAGDQETITALKRALEEANTLIFRQNNYRQEAKRWDK